MKQPLNIIHEVKKSLAPGLTQWHMQTHAEYEAASARCNLTAMGIFGPSSTIGMSQTSNIQFS